MLPLILKWIISFFVFLSLIIFLLKRIKLAVWIIPTIEGRLEKYYIKVFVYDFLLCIGCFVLVMLWSPIAVQKKIVIDPYPAMVGFIVFSVIFSSIGAYGAVNPARTIRLIRKLKDKNRKVE